MEYIYISWKDFRPHELLFKNKSKRNYKLEIAKDFLSLDTETSTTSNKEKGWIYQWCLSYPHPEEGKRYLVYGRRPSELTEVFIRIHEANELSKQRRLICFVHNLSYDYTYFHKFLQEGFQTAGEILAVGPHRLITYQMDGIEFRDSLKIFQKSLAKVCKDLNTKHGKLKDLIDYQKTRYQDSKLNRNDWRYMFRDVVCLDECITEQLHVHNDKIWTIPLTITGYSRRTTKKHFFADYNHNRYYFESKRMNFELYSFCRREFAGALTHGNRKRKDLTVILEEEKKKLKRKDLKIKHRDFRSHYPSQQICKYCPSGRFRLYFDRRTNEDLYMTLEDLDVQYNKGYCYLAAITFDHLRIKKGITLPYGQVVKFYEGRLDDVQFTTDNGRILAMEGESLVIVNELDLKWLRKQYDFDYEIETVYIAKRGRFPKYIRDTCDQYFYGKSVTKDIENDLKAKGYSEFSIERREAHRQNLIEKGLLNAIYGMTATDPIRVAYTEAEDGEWNKERITAADIEERLNKYYDKKGSFMNYELGLWTTAHARDELLTLVELIGYEYFLYGDTDSIFYISTPEIEERIESLNREWLKEAEQKEYYITIEDKKVHYHQFEDEGEDIIEFRFLHSKCYAYVTSDGKLHTTIAGVKDVGRKGNNRSKELGNIDNLTAGTVFLDCGGTSIKYNPKGSDISAKIENINGHETEISQWAIIVDSEKELHDTIEQLEVTDFWEDAYAGID